jgi:hypothetical protein
MRPRLAIAYATLDGMDAVSDHEDREWTLVDFTSLEAQAVPPRSDDPEILRLHSGISCWATDARARRAMRRYPALGTYIVLLTIPDDASIRVERTRGPGHHTVWGEPETISGYVTPVNPP